MANRMRSSETQSQMFDVQSLDVFAQIEALLRAGRKLQRDTFSIKGLSLEASSIANGLTASHFPRLPVLPRSPEQVVAYRANNAWLRRYRLRQHEHLQEYAQHRLSAGQKNYSTVSRDPRHTL